MGDVPQLERRLRRLERILTNLGQIRPEMIATIGDLEIMGNLSTYGYIYPGTGTAIQSTRYIYDNGANIVVDGMAVAADGVITSRKMNPSILSAGPGYKSATPDAEADIDGYTVTFTPDVVALVKVELSVQLQNNTDTDRAIIFLYKDGNLFGTRDTKFFASGIGQPFCIIFYDDNATAAAHTYKLRWQNTHAGDQLGINGQVYISWWAT